MTMPTRREAANKRINKMNTKWERLEDLAMQAKCGKHSLSNREMARFLYEKEKQGIVEKKLVYVGSFGASLQRRVYRKKEKQ